MYTRANTTLTMDREHERGVPGENHCSFGRRMPTHASHQGFFLRSLALRVRVSRSRIADLQRPFISLERWRPREVGSRDMLNFRWFGASVGKQWGNKAQRIHFGAQAGQIHLFFSQHFVYVFHGHQGGPAGP
jgi:hypothetical protein